MLPTNQESNLLLDYENLMHIAKAKLACHRLYYKYQHLYIISNEEIKDNDWYLDFRIATHPIVSNSPMHVLKVDYYKKIIATTDTSLSIINHSNGTWKNLPTPSQSFIEKYVEQYNKSNKGNKITDVRIEYVDNGEEDWSGDNITGLPVWIECLEPVVKNDSTIVIKKVKDSFVKDDLPIDIIESMIAYCEKNQIYDKLANHGDFYYKAKQWLSSIQ